MIGRRLVVGALCAAAVVAACGGDSTSEVTGVVVDVEGDLITVDSFVLRLSDGSDQEFTTAPGVRFHDGGSIGHLRDHLRSAVPVVIQYEVLDDGTWVALDVDDAG